MFQKIKDFLFKNTSARQTVVKNTIWLSISNYGGKIIKAVIVIYGARVLDTAGYGVFSYAVTLSGFIGIFLDPGINSMLIREASKASEEKKLEVLSTTFVIKVALIIIGVLIVIIGGPHFFSTLPGAAALLPLIAFMLSFDTLRDFFTSFLRAREKMEWEAGVFLFTNLMIVVMGFIFLYISPTAKAFAWSYVLGTGIGAVVALIVIFPDFRRSIAHFSYARVFPILQSAWPFAVIGALGLLLTNADILIISWMRSASDVGIYSADIRIVQAMYLVPGILQASTLPVFSRFAKRDNAKFRESLERTLGIVFLISIPIAIGGAILSVQILGLVFGPAYVIGSWSFSILMLGIIFDYPASIIASAVFAYEHQKSLIISSAIAGIANVVLDIILISRFGIVGSAVATFAAQILSNWYLWHVMKKINYFKVLPFIKKICIAGAIMTAATALMYFLGVNVVINIVLSSIVYLGALRMLREPLLIEIKRTMIGPTHA